MSELLTCSPQVVEVCREGLVRCSMLQHPHRLPTIVRPPGTGQHGPTSASQFSYVAQHGARDLDLVSDLSPQESTGATGHGQVELADATQGSPAGTGDNLSTVPALEQSPKDLDLSGEVSALQTVSATGTGHLLRGLAMTGAPEDKGSAEETKDVSGEGEGVAEQRRQSVKDEGGVGGGVVGEGEGDGGVGDRGGDGGVGESVVGEDERMVELSVNEEGDDVDEDSDSELLKMFVDVPADVSDTDCDA